MMWFPARRPPPLFPAFFLALCLAGGLPAQEGWPEGSINQIPRQLFAGDRGRLTLNLGSLFPETSSFSISDSWFLPQSPELRLHRLEFDAQRAQLSIDFTAFAPGELEIPPIKLSQLPGFSLEGCRVNIASVLALEDQGVLVLSGPAPPLAAPGTALLIYGSSSLMILLLLALLGAWIWGRPWLGRLLEARRRQRLIRLMGQIGEDLRGRISPASSPEILRVLSVEFRAFLAYFFEGEGDCRAMTAEEFSARPLFPPAAGMMGTAEGLTEGMAAGMTEGALSPASLGNFFRRLDRLRFSGEGAGNGEISALLDQMGGILRAIERGRP